MGLMTDPAPAAAPGPMVAGLNAMPMKGRAPPMRPKPVAILVAVAKPKAAR